MKTVVELSGVHKAGHSTYRCVGNYVEGRGVVYSVYIGDKPADCINRTNVKIGQAIWEKEVVIIRRNQEYTTGTTIPYNKVT